MATSTSTANPIVRGGFRKNRNYTGARVTHLTYTGVFERRDGERGHCGHAGHQTPDTACDCVRKIVKREQAAGR